MKTRLIATFLALSGVTTFAYGQNPRNAARDAVRNAAGQNRNEGSGREVALKALEHHYGEGVAVKITGERDENGVHIYTAEASRNGGTAPAAATAAGELIETGLPGGMGELPPPVREVTQGLFHTSPTDVDLVDTHYYFVRVATGGHEYVVMFDATGHVTQISSPMQLREAAPQSEAAAGGADRGEVEKHVRRRFDNVNVTDVRAAPNFPGFYNAYFTHPGGAGMATLNARDELVSYRMPRAINTFPQPVQRAVEALLKGDQIKNAGIGSERLFHVTQNLGNEQISLLVHADGEVENVGEHRAGAITAASRSRK